MRMTTPNSPKPAPHRALHAGRATRRIDCVAAWGALVACTAVVAACSSSPNANDAGKFTAATGTSPTAPPGNLPEMNAGTTTPKSATEAEDALTSAERELERLVGTDSAPSPLSTDGCVTVCKAVASIRNAAEHVCALSQDEPSRCESARDRAERAAERAKSACPSCSDS